jgi:hypothetical protein
VTLGKKLKSPHYIFDPGEEPTAEAQLLQENALLKEALGEWAKRYKQLEKAAWDHHTLTG